MSIYAVNKLCREALRDTAPLLTRAAKDPH